MMRLITLHPRWFEHDGKRVGFTFLCPHCQEIRISCKLVPLDADTQERVFNEPNPGADVVGCTMVMPEDTVSTITGENWSDTTVVPVIVTDGEHGTWKIERGEVSEV